MFNVCNGTTWACVLQTEENPALKIQQGVDIHECIAKINSLAPTELCNADLIFHCHNELQGRSVRDKFKYYVEPHGSSYRRDIDGRRLAKSDLKVNRRPQQVSRHIDSAVPSAPSKSLLNHDLYQGSKYSHRMQIERNATLCKDSSARTVEASSHTLQASRGRSSAPRGQGAGHQDLGDSHAGLDRASDDGSNSLPRVILTAFTEKLAFVNSTTERPEDSSSFHTPNETLEAHSTRSDSPCSSLRKDLHPPNFPECNASEGDQMSGVSQPPLETVAPVDEMLRTDSYATKQRPKRVEPRELQDLEGCGSISPIEERSSRKVSEQRSNFTIDTSSRVNASEDAFHLTAELNDEWKRLEMFHREVSAILFRK